MGLTLQVATRHWQISSRQPTNFIIESCARMKAAAPFAFSPPTNGWPDTLGLLLELRLLRGAYAYIASPTNFVWAINDRSGELELEMHGFFTCITIPHTADDEAMDISEPLLVESRCARRPYAQICSLSRHSPTLFPNRLSNQVRKDMLEDWILTVPGLVVEVLGTMDVVELDLEEVCNVDDVDEVVIPAV